MYFAGLKRNNQLNIKKNENHIINTRYHIAYVM